MALNRQQQGTMEVAHYRHARTGYDPPPSFGTPEHAGQCSETADGEQFAAPTPNSEPESI
jgi:hypothetical protein